jgi:hypothetical protein
MACFVSFTATSDEEAGKDGESEVGRSPLLSDDCFLVYRLTLSCVVFDLLFRMLCSPESVVLRINR